MTAQPVIAPGSAAARVPTTLIDPTDWLACAMCGVRVDGATVTEAKDVTAVSPAGTRQKEQTLDLTTCADCQATAEQVERILLAHPGLVGVRGPAGARRAVQNVVAALAALSMPAPPASVSAADLSSLVHHLTEVGSTVPFRHVAGPGRAAPYRFAHLTSEQTQALRTAYGALLHERASRHAPAATFPPPPRSARRGCLFCGVGTVAVPAAAVARAGRESAAAAAWHPRSATTTALGRPSPDTLRGHLCPECAGAADSVGSVGPTAMARALVAYLRSTGAEQVARAIEVAERDVIGVQGLVGWGALPPGTPPNAAPWAHLDLAGME